MLKEAVIDKHQALLKDSLCDIVPLDTELTIKSHVHDEGECPT